MGEYTTIRLAAPAGASPLADTAYREVLQLWRCDLIGGFDAPAHAFGFGSF